MIDINVRRAAKKTMLELPQMMMTQPWRRHSSDLRSNEKSEIYQGLGGWPAVERFVKERSYEAIGQREYTVDSIPWALSTEFDSDDVKREAGRWVVQEKLPNMAQVFASHPNGLFFTLLEDTTSIKTVDGVTFFNAAHPVIGSDTITNSNIVSGAGVTAANIITDWYKVVKAFADMRTRSGDRIFEDVGQLRYNILYPMDLDAVMTEVFLKQAITGSATQGALNQENVRLEKYSRLTDTADWYVKVDNFPTFQPFFFFIVKAPTFKWNASEDREFERQTVAYGGTARYKMHFGHHETMVKVNNT
jgi:phage major head subunit gpT-like protein